VPVSRNRKINRARKRPRVAHSSSTGSPDSSRANRNLRIGAAIVLIALAAGVVWYVMKNGGEAGAEDTTESGLKIQDLRVGDGPSPKPGQTIKVHYVGTLENGQEFDNSYKKGGPVDFRIGVGAVIKGWDEGLMGMKVGGKRKLFIPSDLGYGPVPRPKIPPNSNLLFEIELLGIN